MRTPGETGPGSHVLKPRQDTGLGAFNKEAGCETRGGEGIAQETARPRRQQPGPGSPYSVMKEKPNSGEMERTESWSREEKV